ncbi:carotenoid oxygenase family protein [Actinomadura barringtoniae]|uniref:Dioxygenase n=1 Tax=Actinomadura barringtoniae TaxID=1427535 RepID=A0A939TGU2_9ACTN|nr:carotenoid oxygenase family protein [Actinomadura barringtoniae]MBO2455770.1 carotenoid oxygenase family protein [Actinomadura barringtoniae]
MVLTAAPGRHWAPIQGEFDLAVTEITGRLPAGLTGTLYRNGSGRWDIGSTAVDCLFDTDGMISAFALDGQGVRFRNRFVRTKQYVRGERAGRMTTRGLGQQRPGGVAANALRGPANTANTSVLVHNQRLLALWEAGRPYVLDLDSLETLGQTNLGGTLKGLLGAYSAHYVQDPHTGSVVNFGFDPYLPRLDLRWVREAATPAERLRRMREQVGEARPRVRLRLYETDRAGTTRYLRSVPLPAMCYIHDMALTRNYAIFAATPWRIDPLPIAAGTSPMLDAMHFVRNAPSYFLLAPRAVGPVRVVETDPFFMVHFANAFEVAGASGDEVVVDLPRYAPETFHTAMAFFADPRSAPAAGGTLTRYRIGATGKVTTEQISDALCEAPQFDQRRSTKDYRWSYSIARTDGVSAPLGPGFGIARFDHRTGAADTYITADDGLIEPVFVPRSPDAAEDDGWILTVGYSASEHRSRLMVFDAAHLPDGPVAEAWLPFHVPISFHGTFTERVAT